MMMISAIPKMPAINGRIKDEFASDIAPKVLLADAVIDPSLKRIESISTLVCANVRWTY